MGFVLSFHLVVCFLFFLPASFALCFALLLGVGVRWAMASSGSDRSSSGDADAISRAVAEACKAQEWSKGIRLLNKLPDTITSPRLLWYVFYVCMYAWHPCTTIVRPPSSPFSWNLLHCCPLGGERECVLRLVWCGWRARGLLLFCDHCSLFLSIWVSVCLSLSLSSLSFLFPTSFCFSSVCLVFFPTQANGFSEDSHFCIKAQSGR